MRESLLPVGLELAEAFTGNQYRWGAPSAESRKGFRDHFPVWDFCL